VVLGDGDTLEGGVREADMLMARPGVRPEQLIEGAYVDLLARAA